MFGPPKVLIAVITCHKYRERADACRKTWVTKVGKRADVRFFIGRRPEDAPKLDPLPDEIQLDCPDSYEYLPLKVWLMFRWATTHNYKLVFKTDDDSYIQPDELLRTLPKEHYVGHANSNGHGEVFATGWWSGLGYWVTRRAMGMVLRHEPPVGESEDRWVGTVLTGYGIHPTNDDGIYPASCTPQRNAVHAGTKCTAELSPEDMWLAFDGPHGWRERAAVAEFKRAQQLRQQKITRGDGTRFFQ